MDQKNVLYVSGDLIAPVINEENLAQILGKLPERPELSAIPALEAVARGMINTKGETYAPRYALTPGSMSLPSYERAQLMAQMKKVDGKWVITHDFIELQDSGVDSQTGESGQNPVIVPMEYYRGEWYMHAQLQYRLRMGWTLNCVGGYAPKGKSFLDAAMTEIAEEFGVAEVLGKIYWSREDGYEFFANRATYRNGIGTGIFVFKTPSWTPSTDPGGFEIINGQRLAIPVKGYSMIPDLVAHAGFSTAVNLWRYGYLDQYEVVSESRTIKAIMRKKTG